VTGTFDLHNYAASATDIKGRFLDGPFEASVSPDPAGANGSIGVNVRATGHLSGQRLPAFIGLPDTIEMRGMTAWTVALKSSRRSAADDWFTRIGIASNLSGLEIDAPRPFAKTSAELRDTRVRIDVDPGDRNDVDVQSGAAHAQLAFVQRGDRWQLDRGIARFDGGSMRATLKPGLQVLGAWPEFDLGEWLALRSTSAAGPSAPVRNSLTDWLSQVDVQLDEARVFGYQLRNVQAHMTNDGTNWLVDLSCPMAEGRVIVPIDTAFDEPIVLGLKRLQLQSAPKRAADDGVERPADPRQSPPLQASVDDFTWEGRHFGRMTADIRHDADGLSLTSLRTESPALTPDEGTTRAIEFPLLAIVLVPRSRTKAGGAGPAELSTVTWTGTDVVRFPAASHATAARVWLPVVPLAFQDVEYGGDVDTPPSGDPSS